MLARVHTGAHESGLASNLASKRDQARIHTGAHESGAKTQIARIRFLASISRFTGLDSLLTPQTKANPLQGPRRRNSGLFVISQAFAQFRGWSRRAQTSTQIDLTGSLRTPATYFEDRRSAPPSSHPRLGSIQVDFLSFR